MAYSITNESRYKKPCCTFCDCRIRLLEDPQSLALFLGAKSVQRRALLCMNCGRLLCKECSQNEFWCSCGSNAWVALPYLGDSTVEEGAYPVNGFC